MNQGLHLGLDVGSGTAKGVVLDTEGQLLYSCYHRTLGKPLQVAYEILSEIEDTFSQEQIFSMTCTGTGGKNIASILQAPFVNEVICHTKGVEFFHPQARTIIDIGGEDAKLILIKSNQDNSFYIQDFALNTVCAAGTGAFLEQQAARMGYSIDTFSKLALKADLVPSIAGRCTVFAKSDMIHLQQNGVSDYEIIAGLCFAIVRNLKTNIAKGKTINPPLVFQGGVAANYGVRRAMRELMLDRDEDLIIPEHFKVMGAVGAALEGKRRNRKLSYKGSTCLQSYIYKDLEDAGRLSCLKVDVFSTCYKLDKTSSQEKLTAKQDTKKVFLGLDVGSVSTKLVLLSCQPKDLTGFQVIVKTYLQTASRPLEAIKKGLEEIVSQVDEDIQIAAAGTTGSGRYLSGDFIGADVVRNEITAQATAAKYIYPEVETIFEIGGQDSKYIQLDKGTIIDFAMNKVCAAGTGSFLEEQSVRLGIDIDEFGQLALSSEAPVKMGERCTVFMQSDLVHYQQKGAVKQDLAAGLCYSIVANYLNKVVEQRAIGNKILFQGGTAFNQGIVAAFRKVLNKDIQVAPDNEVTGAIGAALLAAQEHTGKSGFKGFDLRHRSYSTQIFECQGCVNRCEIQKIKIEGEKKPFYYGHRCEQFEQEKNKKTLNQPDLIREREALLVSYGHQAEQDKSSRPQIGLPRVVFFQEWLPFFSTLFQELGFQVVLSSQTSKKVINAGISRMVTETCLPIKVAHGHVLDLMDKGVEKIFLPQIVEIPGLDDTNPGKICPYVQGLPWMLQSAIDLTNAQTKILSPVLSLDRENPLKEKGWKDLADQLKVSWWRMKKSISKAWQAQEDFRQRILERGREILSRVEAGEKAMLILGRPYNSLDPGLNMDLSQKLRKMDLLAIPMDYLPLNKFRPGQEFHNMYWAYGQKILAAGQLLSQYPNLFPIFVTNFSCGPDAFILHFFEKMNNDRPFLELEIDEHTADAGVITRLEAFWDSAKLHSTKKRPRQTLNPRCRTYKREWTLYIPPMTDHLHAFAAAFAAQGLDVRLLPASNDESLRLGRKYTKGKECLPAVLTTGDILRATQREDFDPKRSAFFMPSAGGPCRFGLYHQLHRKVLKEVGLDNVPVFAPEQGTKLYEELGVVGKEFSKQAWKGVVGVDLLLKFLHETRPYAEDKEKCREVYNYYLNRISQAIYNQEDLQEIMLEANQAFQDINIVKEIKKPVVGIVGEIYVRSNSFANENLIANLEDLGMEAWLPTISEWIHYINYTSKKEAFRDKDWKRWLKMFLEIRFQTRIENKILGMCNGWLRSIPEPETSELIKAASPFIHPRFEGEAILSIGKSLDYMEKNVHGLINVMPFTCMPGGIVDTLFKRIKNIRDLPMLTVVYDGQKETNTRNRLEAFVYQVKQSQARFDSLS